MIRQLALALLVGSWSLSAQAQAPSDVAVRSADQLLVQSGISAFNRRDYPLALTLLKRAAVSVPCVTVRLYLARTRSALGMLLEAADDYRSVIATAEPVEPAEAARLATDARDELAQLRPRIPSIEVALGDLEQRSRNLRLIMDGRMIAYSAPIQVNPGHHEIIASDIEGEQARLSVEINEGESKTVGMSWRGIGGRPSKKSEQAIGGSAARRAWGVVALGVGATGLGVGTVTGIAAMTRYSRAEAHCPANRCVEGTPMPEDGSAFRTLRNVSIAGYAAGAAGIGTWLGLLLTTPAQKPEHPKVSPWTPVVGVGSAGARYVF